MLRKSGRPVAVMVIAALSMTLAAVGPGRADVTDDPVSVPPTSPLEPAPTGPYLDRAFTFSRTQTNVPYGLAPLSNDRGDQTLVLDVYEPDGDTLPFRPVVVWVHGGYFKFSNKNDVNFVHELTRRGYVVVSINYRLQDDTFPTGLGGIVSSGDPENIPKFVAAVREAQHDAMAAIRWVRAHASELRVDASRVAVAGHSAGGLTTMNVLFNQDDPGTSNDLDWPSTVAAGVSSAGAYGPGISGDPAQPGNSPMLVLHGTHDDVVPVVGATLPCANTLSVGNVCEQRLYPGAGHNGMSLEDKGATSALFLHRHVVSAPRVATSLENVTTTTRGEGVTVAGRLVRDGGAPVAGEVVFVRATGAWVSAVTGPDGSFTAAAPAPEHGRTASVSVRYNGRYEGAGVLAENLGPVLRTVSATWGAA